MDEMEGSEDSLELQKDAHEIKSKDIHYNGQAGDDVWFRMLGFKEEGRKLNTTEMRMLRMMLCVTLQDKLRNEEVRRRTTVTTSVVTIIERSKLRWYSHLLRKNQEEVVRQA